MSILNEISENLQKGKAKIVKELTPEQMQQQKLDAMHYVQLAQNNLKKANA